MSDLAGFFLSIALFTSVAYVTDAWIYSKGYDTALFKYKTVHEKRIQEALVKKLESE